MWIYSWWANYSVGLILGFIVGWNTCRIHARRALHSTDQTPTGAAKS